MPPSKSKTMKPKPYIYADLYFLKLLNLLHDLSTDLFHLVVSTTSIQVAEVAVPSQRDNVDDENSMLEGDELEVDSLNSGPNHVVLLNSSAVVCLDLLFGADSFQHRHDAEEHAQVDRSQDTLICCDTGSNFEVLVLQHDLILEEFEPVGSNGTEDT